jgi:hypothetical protein
MSKNLIAIKKNCWIEMALEGQNVELHFVQNWNKSLHQNDPF